MNNTIRTTILIALIATASNATTLTSVTITDVPHVKQKPDFCGEACAEMFLRKLGQDISQDDVFDISGVNPIHARGCHTAELARSLSTIGFKTGKVWHHIASGSDTELHAQWTALHTDLVRNVPSVVCMRTDNTTSATEHFRLVLGYDAETNEVIYHEPAETAAAYQRMKLKTFLECWPLKYDRKKWTVIRIRLEPDKISTLQPATDCTDADYAQHMMDLKKRIPSQAFTTVIQKPFVVIGDESPELVRARAERTVKWATDRLKAMYFKKDPDKIIDIWLFKDKPSYEKHTWKIFRDRPDTPFGYSSPENAALIMNIGTGGGTLVHEIVHPFVSANFPDCPSWLNEGLGSLYEQSGGKGTEIVGLTNWRLADLQKAIRKKRVPSFKTLTSTTTDEFYLEDPGTNYAQARYLCYYLQEKGLLKKFYHRFVSGHKKDPTGYNTLKEVLNEKDMAAFQKKWEAFVTKLSFP
jgi:hypothetical protein